MSNDRNSSNAAGKMIIGLAGLVSILIFMMTMQIDKTTSTVLDPVQKGELMGYGYAGIVDNIQSLNCESSVADFMNTAIWNDRWCADRYEHLFVITDSIVTFKDAL